MEKCIKPTSNNIWDILESNAYFVDKTEFIASVSSRTIIAYPRRFGKSMLLSLLHEFYHVHGNHAFFLDKKIIHNKWFVHNHMGKYWVISINVGGVEFDSKTSLLTSIANIVESQIQRVRDECVRSCVPVKHLDKLDNLSNKLEARDDIELSLFNLTDLVYRALKLKTVFLIDEFDKPLYLSRKYNSPEVNKQIRHVFYYFYNFKGQNRQFIQTAVLAGTQTFLLGIDLLHGVNEFERVSIEHPSRRLHGAFGFTDDEVNQLCDHVDKLARDSGSADNIMTLEVKETLNKRYAGYFKTQQEKGNLYNPYSIMSCLKDLVDNGCNGCNSGNGCNGYWVDSGSIEALFMTYKISVVELLLAIEGQRDYGLNESLYRFLSPNNTRESVIYRVEYIRQILLGGGYVTTDPETQEVKLPNEEVSQHITNYLHKKIVEICEPKYIIRALEECKMQKLRDTLLESFGDFSECAMINESHYHAVAVVLLRAWLGPSTAANYEVISNQRKTTTTRKRRHHLCPLDMPRTDIILLPVDGTNGTRAYIFEFKKCRGGSRQKLATDAVTQILINKYYDVVDVKFTSLILVGICCDRQSITMVGCELTRPDDDTITTTLLNWDTGEEEVWRGKTVVIPSDHVFHKMVPKRPSNRRTSDTDAATDTAVWDELALIWTGEK